MGVFAVALAPLILLLFCYFCYVGFYRHRKNRNVPPGPWGIPYLGYLPFLGPHPRDTFNRLGEKYGNIFSFYLGSRLAVVLNDHQAITEALQEQAEVFSGRAGGFVASYLRTGVERATHGIGTPGGSTFKEGRKFMLQTFRDLGMGKSKLQGSIIQEANGLVDLANKFNGQPFDPFPLLNTAVANCVGALCFGPEFSRNDPSFGQVLTGLSIAESYRYTLSPLQWFPWLRFLPGPFQKMWHQTVANTKERLQFVRGMVKEHRVTFSQANTRDYIDAFFHRQAHIKGSGADLPPIFKDEELEANLGSFFGAGMTLTAVTLTWALVFLLNYPDVQKRIHQELDQRIDLGHVVELEDRAKLPYVEAVIREVLRLADTVPLILPRANLRETVLLGHRIPADSVIFSNFKAVNDDPALWHDPLVFDPTRFLAKDGSVHEPSHFAPFSLGKRACVGESLARMILFLLFANLMQQLVIKTPPGIAPPLLTQRVTSQTSTPMPFRVCAVPRIKMNQL